MIMLDLAIDSRVFIDNEIDAALQELDMLFNTENTELIGYPTYGTNFEQFLWNLNPSPNEVKNYIVEKFANTLYLNRVESYIYVDILEGEYRSIYQVVIQIGDDNNPAHARIYQLR